MAHLAMIFKNMGSLAWNLILHQKKYYIVHSDNIIKIIIIPHTNIIKVDFYNKGEYVRGELVLSSEQQEVIVAQIKNKSFPHNPVLKNNLEEFNWFLVQFKSHTRNVSFGVIHNSQVNWNKSTGNDLILTDGMKTENLYASMNEKIVSEKLNTIKATNFDGIFKLSKHQVGLDSPNWILIQYSTGLNNLIYEVIEEKTTTYITDLVAYVRSGKAVYQAQVLKRSVSFYEVLETLEFIQSNLYAKRKNPINNDISRINTLEIDLIDCQLLLIFQQQNIENYFHHDGRSLNFLKEKAAETVEI